MFTFTKWGLYLNVYSTIFSWHISVNILTSKSHISHLEDFHTVLQEIELILAFEILTRKKNFYGKRLLELAQSDLSFLDFFLPTLYNLEVLREFEDLLQSSSENSRVDCTHRPSWGSHALYRRRTLMKTASR